jgi:hypothetical protein
MVMPPRVHQNDIRAVIDLIAPVFSGHFAKRGAERSGELEDVDKLSGDAGKPRIEIGHILGEDIDSISSGIHRHHHHSGVTYLSRFQLLH